MKNLKKELKEHENGDYAKIIRESGMLEIIQEDLKIKEIHE